MLVLGETHFARMPGRSPAPSWLTIPQRGLYTGVMILGAVGSGKTSACMYPYVQQPLRWRAGDTSRKLGGLVLEVKGDFCNQVRAHSRGRQPRSRLCRSRPRHRLCYNPLHNDLRRYAVAYALGSLLLAIERERCQGDVRRAPFTLWVPLGQTHVGHRTDAELKSYLAEHTIPFELRTGCAAICADRRHRLEAIQRWFNHTWRRLDPKVKLVADEYHAFATVGETARQTTSVRSRCRARRD